MTIPCAASPRAPVLIHAVGPMGHPKSEPPEPKRLERGEIVVERVLDAAAEEIALTGYAALTLERVAARAGVNRTTIYRRWPTKSALAIAAMHHVVSRIDLAFDEGSLRDDLRVLVESTSKAAFAPATLGLARIVTDAPDEKEIVELAQRLQAEKTRESHALIRRWRERGELRPGLDGELFFESIMGILCLRAVIRQEPVTPAMTDDLVDYFCAVAAPPVTIVKSKQRKPAAGRASRPKRRPGFGK